MKLFPPLINIKNPLYQNCFLETASNPEETGWPMKDSAEIIKFDSAGTPLPALSDPTPTPQGAKDTSLRKSQRSPNPDDDDESK